MLLFSFLSSSLFLLLIFVCFLSFFVFPSVLIGPGTFREPCLLKMYFPASVFPLHPLPSVYNFMLLKRLTSLKFIFPNEDMFLLSNSLVLFFLLINTNSDHTYSSRGLFTSVSLLFRSLLLNTGLQTRARQHYKKHIESL